MRILFENVNFNSRSGPNGFGLKLARQFVVTGSEIVSSNPDVCLSFIQSSNHFNPTVLRLDGIYFNATQNWEEMNAPIKRSYDLSQSIVVQSEFDKDLIFNFFGKRDNVYVISNGTDLDAIEKIERIRFLPDIPKEKIWMCASSWRPHKRLKDNIRLFQMLADNDSILLVAGENSEKFLEGETDPRIKNVGNLTWEQMISCMKSSGNFIHLSWLDHCPNVVIDAKACGCKLHVSNSGGTPELVDENDLIYEDVEYRFNTIDLYNPPTLTLNTTKLVSIRKNDISISSVAKKYYDVLRNLT